MAKRKTLRKQRDKALKELAEYKRMAEVRRIGSAMMSQRYYDQIARLKAYYDYHDAEEACGFVDKKLLTRSMLHKLVDSGQFDQAVTSIVEPIGIGKNRLLIEVNVLKAEQAL